MKTIGFVKSDKENEYRIALVPKDLRKIKNTNMIYIEKGYGNENNYSDEEYSSMGCHIVSKEEVLGKDIIVDPKIGDAKYLNSLKNKIVFGWIHAVQNRDITDCFINNKLTGYAWEEMFEEGRHVFWRNNEVAGEAAVMHALIIHGIMPYDAKVAIIGNGNTSRGAYRVLTQLGAKVKTYNRKTENLFRKEIGEFDIVVNAVLWDVTRKDHIINKKDLSRMKCGGLLIDISCDKNGAIETSVPTTINNPTYFIDGIRHYVVDHTPSLFYKTISKELSKEVSKYIDDLIEEKTNIMLEKCKIIENGVILDKNINIYQSR